MYSGVAPSANYATIRLASPAVCVFVLGSKLAQCFVQPALVAEVLHNPKMDKVEEVYDGIRPMMSDAGHPDLVTSYTDESWRLVRKGVAPAFSPHNIRSVPTCPVKWGKALGPDRNPVRIPNECKARVGAVHRPGGAYRV